MATFESFEQMAVWQKARELTTLIYRLTSEGEFARDFALRDQIRRAAISVMSNIAEGFERDGTREFINFLSIAKGSAGEVRAQLYIALDQNYLKREVFDDAIKMTVELGRMTRGFIRYLQGSKMRGAKFS